MKSRLREIASLEAATFSRMSLVYAKMSAENIKVVVILVKPEISD